MSHSLIISRYDRESDTAYKSFVSIHEKEEKKKHSIDRFFSSIQKENLSANIRHNSPSKPPSFSSILATSSVRSQDGGQEDWGRREDVTKLETFLK